MKHLTSDLHVLFLLILVMTAGCNDHRQEPSEGTREQPDSIVTEKRKDLLWQLRKPKMQFDPIHEQEIPSVFHPLEKEKE